MKIGLDIGGTKCAISTGECADGAIKILSREEFPTAGLSWQQVLDEFARDAQPSAVLEYADLGLRIFGELL